MIIQGKKVQLRPMTEEEIPMFYSWASESDAAPFWYGELYKNKIPSIEEFRKDLKGYFDNNHLENGHCFVILVNNEPIGEINYNKIENNETELDIIIANKINQGKGFGSDAIKTLVKYLFEKMNIKKCWIEPTSKNPRAIKSYEKAGFKKIKTFIKNSIEWIRMEIQKQKNK